MILQFVDIGTYNFTVMDLTCLISKAKCHDQGKCKHIYLYMQTLVVVLYIQDYYTKEVY